jgi:phage terminase Nu1 subunit (DNA packaging protein)
MSAVNLGEAAQIAGVSVNTVRAWLRRGLPAVQRQGEWRIDVEAMQAWRQRHLAAARPSAGKREIEAARARKLAAEAAMAEIDLALKCGDAVSIADAARGWAELVAAFRARILALPARLAPALVAETDLLRARAAVEAALHEALRELGRHGEELCDGAGGACGAAGGAGGAGGIGASAAIADGQPMG